MSAAYQPVPTIAQRKALQRDHERRYRDAAIGEYRAAQLRYEMERLSKQPEPAQFCAVARDEDEGPALFGMVDAIRAEFGPLWPVWAAAYFMFIAAGLVALVAILWSVFA